MRRNALLMVAGVSIAFTAAGCSDAQSANRLRTSTTTASTTAASSASEPSTTSTATPTAQPVGTSASTSTALGEVTMAPGAAYTVSGSGCTPGAPVHVTLEAPTHATAELASQPSDSAGGFSITVKVPQLKSPTADLSAFCVSSNASGSIQKDVAIRFTG
jgi:hypothetical protein